MHNPDILIIGGGPTGLMLACQLAIHKINFRIIDKSEDHTTQSRALVIQARSMEILDQMGLAEKAIQQGTVAKAIGAFFNGKKVLRVTVEKIGGTLTRFPYLLMLEQSRTESLLVNFLKEHHYEVERNVELITISQNDHEVISGLRLPDGQEETVRSKYVIGADGAHSDVREQLSIPFGGKTYEETLFVMDCKAEVDLPHDEMYLTFADNALGGFFPLTNGRWRILGNVPKELESKAKITFEDIEKKYAERVKMRVRLYDPQWVAVYRAHHRYASTFRKDRCFLAGDAAHIHSPVGAQGMNTGLQDAYNLAWKLILMLNGKASTGLLDTYTEERIPIARQLVRTTDRAFNLVTSDRFFLRNFRMYIMPIVFRSIAPLFQRLTFVQRLAFKFVSEIGISYNGHSLTENASRGKFPGHAPKPGDRLPYILFKDADGKEINLHDKVKGSFFKLFIFSAHEAKDFMSAIAPFKEFISVESIPYNELTEALYRQMGIEENSFYLVRPDRYVAYRSSGLDVDHFKKYLSKIFIS